MTQAAQNQKHRFSGVVSVIAIAVLAFLFFNHVLFILSIENNVVRNDYWRFVHLVDEYHRGDLTFAEFIKPTNGPLKSVFVPLTILIVGVAFWLNVSIIHGGSLVFAFVASLVVLFSFKRWHIDRGFCSSVALIVTPTIAISCSLYPMFGHGQASLSIARASFSLISLIIVCDTISRNKPSKTRLVLSSSSILITVLFFGLTYLPAYVTALALTLFLRLLFANGSGLVRRNSIILASVLFASLFVFSLVLLDFGSLARESHVREAVSSPLDYAHFFVTLHASSLLGTSAKMFSFQLLTVIGVMTLCINILGIFAAIRWGSPAARSTGLLFLIYAPCVMFLISLARTSHGIQASLAGRYLADTPLWQLGALWVFSEMAARGRKREWGSKKWAVALPLIMLMIMAISVVSRNAVDGYRQWRSAPHIKRHLERMHRAIVVSDELGDEKLQKALAITGNEMRYVRRAIVILKEYRLNLFHSPELREIAEAPAAEKVLIETWGPKTTIAGGGFYLQPNGHSAFWFKVLNGHPGVKVVFDGLTLETVYSNGVLTCSVPPELIAEAGTHTIHLEELGLAVSRSVTFRVTEKPKD